MELVEPGVFAIINGHQSWCAYIRTLCWDDQPEPCDCCDYDDPAEIDDDEDLDERGA